MPAFYELNYYARTFYTGDGGTQDFLVTFYGGAPLEPGHIKVYVDQTEVFSGWSLVTINNATKVRFEIPPAETSVGNVMLRRVTPATADTRVIDFSDGSVLTASDLDKSQLNSLYVSQESSDLFLDQGGAGVSINFAETITGSKTFTGTTTIGADGSFKFLQGLATIADKTQGGKQYVLGANGTSGDVHWEETTINPGSLPATVVLTDSNQTIDGQKTFTGSTVISGGLKVTGTAVSGKALVSYTTDGSVAWSPIVNSIKLGSDVAAPSTGTVVITPASIGAIAVGATGATQTVAGPVDFTGSVGLGNDAAADTLTVTSDLNLVIGNQTAGFVLTCLDVDGTAAWVQPTATGVTSVNNKTGPTVMLEASDVGAVSVAYPQEITGAKTFSNNVTLGTASNDIILVGGELQIPGGTNGQVLTSSAGNKVVWQTPEPAGVTMVNGATGPISISADSLGAYSPTGVYPLPVATGLQKGIMQVGSGLAVDSAGVVSVTQNATLPIATADVLGGIKIGSGLSINSATGVVSATLNGSVGVNLFKGRAGDVTPEVNDYQASMIQNADGSNAAVTTDSSQTISAAKKFTVAPTITSSVTTVGIPGSNGVSIEPTGLIKAQRAIDKNLHVWEGIDPAGGVTSFIEADGDAEFSGLVTARGGFYSSAGVTFGDNTADGINLTGTLKFTGSGAPVLNKVMTCKDSLGTVAWEYPLNAPVTTVNGTNGTVSISLYGEASPTANLGGVSLATAQTISGVKTFSANQVFQANVNLGNDPADTITVGGTLVIPQGGANGRVLTCNSSNQGVWTNPIITTVNDQTGAVVITPGNIGAATTGALATLSGLVTDATTLATNASNAAAAAATAAALKLSSVTITTTQIDNLGVSCLSGLGTVDSPLKVLVAPPVGPATGGDLAGSYPSPTIGTNKVTYGKMQQVSQALRLLGNPSAVAGPANVTEISLGAGLSFSGGQLTNAAIPTVSASGTNTFTGVNTFQGNVVVGNEATDTLTVNAATTTNGTVTLGSTNNAANAVTINGPLTITSGSPGVAKVLTSNATGVATWEAPVSPVQWTVKHYLAEQRLFGSYDVIDVSPGNQTINSGLNNINLSSFTVGRSTKYLIRSGANNQARQLDLVIGAGQSCYFLAKDTTGDFAYNAAVGVLLGVASPSSSTATSSYTFVEPTLHSGPTTVRVINHNSGASGWILFYRVS